MKLRLLTRKISNAMPGFLTALGIVGVIGTAVCASLDTKDALEKLEEAKYDHLTKEETVRHVAPCYYRTALTAVGTFVCIAGAHTLNKRQQATIISAYGLLNKRYLDFRKTTKEVAGEEKLREIDAKLAELEAKRKEIEKENGKLLFYEPVTQTFFQATKYEVRDAEYKFEKILHNYGCASVRDFVTYLPFSIDNITEQALAIASSYGWSSDYFVEWWGGEFYSVTFEHIKKTLSDGTPYYMIAYDCAPVSLDYDEELEFIEFDFKDDYYESGEGSIMD